jgi:hypothetical protein
MTAPLHADYEILQVAANLEPTRLFDPAAPGQAAESERQTSHTLHYPQDHSPPPAAAQRSPEFMRCI